MFDDPKKELRELEDQLLAAEENHRAAVLDDGEFEKLYDEILEEFGPAEARDGADAAAEAPPIRNFANGYGGAVHNQPLGNDGDEIMADDEPIPDRRGVRGLVFLACLECAAIAGLAAYWFLNFL